MADLTTEEVRSGFAYVPSASILMRWSDKEADAFDRWLRKHDRVVRAEALRAAADEQEFLAHGPRALGNQVVAFKWLIFANWLRERAAAIARELDR